VRSLIVKVAEELFEHQGYGKVTFKDVAREAGVTESVLHRHFASKAELFREAVLLPLTAVLRSFSDATASYLEHPIDDRTLMRLVMGGLLDQLSNHRAALRGFTAAADDLEAADREEFHRPMREIVTRMGAISRAEAERRGVAKNNLDVDTTIRVSVGMIISVVVHDEWLLRDGPDQLTRAQLLEHITEMMLRSMQPLARHP
jgi:AcrR family transcriptional regulator